MMTRILPDTNDESARREAILQHGKTLLVEAGAGTGKTSVMSGRVAMMLAEGIDPKSIAAITFTELAASELIERIREYVTKLVQTADGKEIPMELKFVLPDGLTETQLKNIKKASAKVDEITCTTIHGFCNKLIRIYPAEAGIDPGASAIDRTHTEIAFADIVENWLRSKLSGEEEEVQILTEFVLNSPDQAVELVEFVAEQIRRHRVLNAPKSEDFGKLKSSFCGAVQEFAKFMNNTEYSDEDTGAKVSEFKRLAELVNSCGDLDAGQSLVRILAVEIDSVLVNKDGSFKKKYSSKGKWEDAASESGYSKADGKRSFEIASENYYACCDGWEALQEAVVCKALADLIEKSMEIMDAYNEAKKQRAQLDFDDMIFLARDMLKGNELVRQELGNRFKHVLVDEFQDTDPVQNEILWRLCGDPPENSNPDCDWDQFRIRPGALFLVGDPKQAIYRFRGADINAYTTARDTLQNQVPDCLVHINRNFRSFFEILNYVNIKFSDRLSSEGQPGFTPLESNREAPDDHLCVSSLEFEVESGNSTSVRKAEAVALADLCSQLIDSHKIYNKKEDEYCTCRPGDIALLAPTGSDLWIYEYELERRNIPISTQVGKGLYRRQEIQDLIALTRVLSDGRDTLALGALLRGPVVGLTEEELMDIVWNLPRSEVFPDQPGRLSIHTNPDDINHDLAREIVGKLKSLYSQRNSTTPHNLLSQAVDELRIRPLLKQRHRSQMDRALANVDLFLSTSTAYDVRGIREFSEAMKTSWAEGEREVEGRPDTKEDAVALHSIHSAKGLEWPIVVPVNSITRKMSARFVVDRTTNTLYRKVLGYKPAGFDAAISFENSELNREHVRLYYVAMTRARDMLIVPRPKLEKWPKNTWAELIDLYDAELPKLKLSEKPKDLPAKSDETINEQSREKFRAEAEKITGLHTKLVRQAPSLKELNKDQPEEIEEFEVWRDDEEESQSEIDLPPKIQGGLERGLILHKLMEEIIIGIIPEESNVLENRAGELIEQLGKTSSENSAEGLSAIELADCVIRTLNLPRIKELRPDLQAEFPVYASEINEDKEIAMAGVVDALTFADDGKPAVIIDWKSDVNPDAKTLNKYQGQVRDYLKMTGAQQGLVVLMTSGKILEA